jgi:hypothetical protein
VIVTLLDGVIPGPLLNEPSDGVAGYIDGNWRWPGAGWTMFPSRRKVRISVWANELADVFDWENGNSSLAEVKDRVQLRATAYLPSVIYCNASSWAEAKAYLKGLPVAWWIAAWTGSTTPPARPMAGACAWQWRGGPGLAYDSSVVDSEIWPGW